MWNLSVTAPINFELPGAIDVHLVHCVSSANVWWGVCKWCAKNSLFSLQAPAVALYYLMLALLFCWALYCSRFVPTAFNWETKKHIYTQGEVHQTVCIYLLLKKSPQLRCVDILGEMYFRETTNTSMVNINKSCEIINSTYSGVKCAYLMKLLFFFNKAI